MVERGINFDDIEEVTLVNQTGLPDAEVIRAMKEQSPELARITEWSNNFSGKARAQGIFQQDRFSVPDEIFKQFVVAADAVKRDDVVSNAVETTEQLAFKRISIETGDDDESNIADQIIDRINLPKVMRSIWRELFTISQCYLAVIWERKDFKVKGVSPSGTKKKKVYKQLLVPKGITVLDPLKIVPVGNFMFGQERLVYIADEGEERGILKSLAGDNKSDMIVDSLFHEQFFPTSEEMIDLVKVTGQTNLSGRLFYLKDENCWRITSTRPDYQRFADVRMASIFEILDLKHNLRESDRSDILGNLNCIILVKKGSDKFPATTEEVAGAHMQLSRGARIPIIVSDHRMEVEIITKKTDNVLRPERYNTLNASITARLYQILNSGNYCLTPDTEILTKSGWKTYENLVIGEEVYTLNTNTGFAEWGPVEAINVFDYEGPMLSMRSRGHSSMSTPNHRWWVETTYGKAKVKQNVWKTSDELSLFDKIPTCAPLEVFPVEATHTDELVELAAWFWTEGHRKADSPNRIEISQSQKANPVHCERIKLLLEKTFGPEGRVAEGGVWYQAPDLEKFYVSASATQPLLDLFEFEKPVNTVPKRPKMDFIYSMTREQMSSFVSTCIDGDGHEEVGGCRRWHQKDYRSIEILEMCLHMLGVSCRSRLDRSREEAGVWSLELLSRSATTPLAAAREASAKGRDAATAEWVPYSGKIWCPTTDNSTWFARRNGVSFFTGNSAGTAVDDSTKLFKIIAAGMEARRDDIRDSIMDRVIEVTWEKNADKLKGDPEMNFYPRRISLDFDPHYAQLIYDAFILGHISRDTMLSELDISQDQEAVKRIREDSLYEDVFEPRQVVEDQKVAGRTKGGNNNGGGMNQDSFNASPKDEPKNPNSKIKDLTDD